VSRYNCYEPREWTCIYGSEICPEFVLSLRNSASANVIYPRGNTLNYMIITVVECPPLTVQDGC
jgi:hypothetical protein